MFSGFSINFTSVLAAQINATLSFIVAQIAIFSLHIFAGHGIGRSPIRLLRKLHLMVAIALSVLVAQRHCPCIAFEVEAGIMFFAYILFVCNTQYSIQLMRNYNEARFGTESRIISRICSVVIYASVAIFVAAICTYIAERYSGVDHQYSLETIIPWGISVISWYHPMMMVVTKYCDRNKEPMKDIEKPFSIRILSIGNSIAMFLACEVHGVILLYHPPTTWKGMIDILGVAFAIGAVYYQFTSPYILLLQAPIHELLKIEKLPLTNADDH